MLLLISFCNILKNQDHNLFCPNQFLCDFSQLWGMSSFFFFFFLPGIEMFKCALLPSSPSYDKYLQVRLNLGSFLLFFFFLLFFLIAIYVPSTCTGREPQHQSSLALGGACLDFGCPFYTFKRSTLWAQRPNFTFGDSTDRTVAIFHSQQAVDWKNRGKKTKTPLTHCFYSYAVSMLSLALVWGVFLTLLLLAKSPMRRNVPLDSFSWGHSMPGLLQPHYSTTAACQHLLTPPNVLLFTAIISTPERQCWTTAAKYNCRCDRSIVVRKFVPFRADSLLKTSGKTRAECPASWPEWLWVKAAHCIPCASRSVQH